MQWTIRELIGIVNGKIEMEDFGETFPNAFNGKELSFQLLYEYLKEHKEYKFSKDTPHESCTCEICENIHLHTRAINRKLKNVDDKLPGNEKIS